MGIWDKLQAEVNRAGRAAQGAFDEGRLRLEIFRVRQLADKAAQALGYAVYRARAKGEELDPAAWDRLSAVLKEHEAEAARLEAELARQGQEAPASPDAAPGEASPASTPPEPAAAPPEPAAAPPAASP